MAPAPDPAAALLGFLALLAASLVLFWPGRGLVPRLRRVVALSDRVRLEDGLKHLFASEVARRSATVESFAGATGVSCSRAIETLRRLEQMGLVSLDGGEIVLTAEGRAYALRVIRTHRLWERYLADHTGVRPADWHTEAERLEHQLAPDQVERLSASLGHPLYDPHGDPIPTAGGLLPPARGVALPACAPATWVRVVQIEDEPEDVYRALRALGIGLGTRLRITGLTPAGLTLVVDGRPVTIDLLSARNVLAEPAEDDEAEAGLERLAALRPGEEGIVVRVEGQVQGTQRRRLLDLGVVPGTVVRAEFDSMSGDPVAYRIRGAMIALRRAQAEGILIRRARRQEAA